ncbi:hypothetical protein DSUL_80046 [Desulfovibrionales bacterium]
MKVLLVIFFGVGAPFFYYTESLVREVVIAVPVSPLCPIQGCGRCSDNRSGDVGVYGR